jgi:SAM-dependent methyltransferase
MEHHAQQHWTDDRALAVYARKEQWAGKIMARLTTMIDRPIERVIEIGSAQGLTLIALNRMGYEAYGVEPWEPAVEQANRLARSMQATIRIERGIAEQILYPDSFADCVIALSVMEHVKDLDGALRECFRVLRPGGVLWFNICSNLSPRQDEISVFPCFGWYPLRLKRRIMWWTLEHRPAWIGHTDTPALQWESPWGARRALRKAGFGEILDRWDFRTELLGRVVASNPLTETLGDVCVTGLSFAAKKP